ncbi:hypothetical protein ACIBAI_17730 [Streptomyces sp. NPDC051041]|uniref:hypothetical protein n=1 Tax=Streptomyces sp. NPDC051041 TaxID=3365640 RepID=UPI0037BB6D77
MPGGKALVRRPGPRLAEGRVARVERQEADVGLAVEQREAYGTAPRAHGVPHLKPAVTALPDGTVTGHVPEVDAPSLLARFPPVPERAGAHAVLLGGGKLPAAASAPGTADPLAGPGHEPVAVATGGCGKPEGCVRCPSARLRELYA